MGSKPCRPPCNGPPQLQQPFSGVFVGNTNGTVHAVKQRNRWGPKEATQNNVVPQEIFEEPKEEPKNAEYNSPIFRALFRQNQPFPENENRAGYPKERVPEDQVRFLRQPCRGCDVPFPDHRGSECRNRKQKMTYTVIQNPVNVQAPPTGEGDGSDDEVPHTGLGSVPPTPSGSGNTYYVTAATSPSGPWRSTRATASVTPWTSGTAARAAT